MTRSPADADLLRRIAAAEGFAATLAEHPSLTLAAVRAQLNALADKLDDRPSLIEKVRDAAAASAKKPLMRVVAPGSLPVARIYSDGAARGNPGPAGAGAVIAEPGGEIVERLGKFLGTQTNNVAEYQGVLIGLRRAQELGVREVEVYADSQLMIRQLGGIYKVKNEGLKPLHAEAVAMLRTFAKVKLVHIPREMNKDADEMSNRAIDERM